MFRIQHAPMTPELWRLVKDNHYGGLVTNAKWYPQTDTASPYLQNDEDFAVLDQTMETAEAQGLGLWLYDEKGYPSGSADGLTLRDHPEYEARGVAELPAAGAFDLPDDFERIVYAVRADGTQAPFTATHADEAACVYAIRPMYEGGHAVQNGWHPRHYPNIMDPDAVDAFLDCTYRRYAEKCKNFPLFSAVFTDEPSLMSGFVNCPDVQPHVYIPWEEHLPERFEQAHGRPLYPLLPEIFSPSPSFSLAKRQFWQTVGDMVHDAFFSRIAAWCGRHGIAYSGHCLLEEEIDWHVPLYGDLMQQLQAFDYPGVDMLTGDPEQYRRECYLTAPCYVGSAARISGKTERVMCEICPIAGEATLEQEIGTMDLIFFSGINHINAYLQPGGALGEGGFAYYADYFGRVASVLRGSEWQGQIGVYYPIETVQGTYVLVDHGINNAPFCDTNRVVTETVHALQNGLWEHQLDSTFIDASFVQKACVRDGRLQYGAVSLSVILMPAVLYADDAVMEKLTAFEQSGGKVFWLTRKPETVTAPLENNLYEALSATVSVGLTATSTHPDRLFISPFIKDGRRGWYVLNSCAESSAVTFTVPDAVEVWCNWDGSGCQTATITMPPYTSAFVWEKC